MKKTKPGRWRYRVQYVTNAEGEEYWLKQMGDMGWELVQVVPGHGWVHAWSVLYFKRPV